MQLQNQHFQLLLNGNPITDLTFDAAGTPSFEALVPAPTRAFCAVITLTLGEFPPAPGLTLRVQTEPERKRPRLREQSGDFGDA
jgi:hypothetical protein